MDGEVRVSFTKWGGRRHWEFTLEELGADGFGHWLGGRAGIPLQRGDEEPIEQPHDVVMLVPSVGCWTAYWNSAPSVIELYIDVTTLPVWAPGSLKAVDLDLDVARFRDGRVELLDEDEFDEHQLRYGYPADVIEQARRTADELMDAVRSRAEPFDAAGERWLARFTGGTAAGRP